MCDLSNYDFTRLIEVLDEIKATQYLKITVTDSEHRDYGEGEVVADYYQIKDELARLPVVKGKQMLVISLVQSAINLLDKIKEMNHQEGSSNAYSIKWEIKNKPRYAYHFQLSGSVNVRQ